MVHVAAVVFAAFSLRLSYRPADEDHLYGHAKISFFSAGFEGAMIVIAALYIIYVSVQKWISGLQLENLGTGTALTALAVVINGGLGGYLVWLGRQKNSIILTANGKHGLTDCWSSIAVLVGLTLVLTTRWLPFDPICGIIMAGNILWSGVGLMKSAFFGLMDKADPLAQAKLLEILDRETQQRGLSYHKLRHRNMGDSHWVEVHLLFPEGASLAEAHRIATSIERLNGRLNREPPSQRTWSAPPIIRTCIRMQQQSPRTVINQFELQIRLPTIQRDAAPQILPGKNARTALRSSCVAEGGGKGGMPIPPRYVLLSV